MSFAEFIVMAIVLGMIVGFFIRLVTFIVRGTVGTFVSFFLVVLVFTALYLADSWFGG